MKRLSRSGVGWAIGLVASGLFLLIWNFGLLAPYSPWTEVLLALLLLAVTVGFFSGYLGGHEWWRLIPAWIMAALTAMVLLNITPAIADEVVVAVLFVGMTAAFVHIYLLDRYENWWALLPAGFTLVIALVTATSALTHNISLLGSLLFGGMGMVFFVLYAMSRGMHHWWSLIPGSVLLIFSLVILTSQSAGESSYLRWWPVLLILGGLVVLWFTDSTPTSRPQPKVAHFPTTPRYGNATRHASATEESAVPGSLGDYQQPAPGASVDLLPERDER